MDLAAGHCNLGCAVHIGVLAAAIDKIRRKIISGGGWLGSSDFEVLRIPDCVIIVLVVEDVGVPLCFARHNFEFRAVGVNNIILAIHRGGSRDVQRRHLPQSLRQIVERRQLLRPHVGNPLHGGSVL